MRIRREPSFERDLRRVRDANIRHQLDRKLAELQAARRMGEVGDALSMRGVRGLYRIRVGRDYRLGVMVDGDVVTLMRFRHRREMYRGFP